MSQVRITVPSLNGGVSQQDPALRQPNTVADMFNMLPDPVWGALRRMGTSHLATLTDFQDDTVWRILDRGLLEQYAVAFRADGIRAWNIFNGDEFPVIQEGPTDAYIQGDRESNLIGEPEGYTTTGAGTWQSGSFGSPVNPIQDGQATAGFTRTPDGITVADGATAIRSRMDGTSSASDTLAQSFGFNALGTDSSIPLGDDRYMRLGVWVRRGDDEAGAFGFGFLVNPGSAVNFATLQVRFSVDADNQWTPGVTVFSAGSNHPLLDAADYLLEYTELGEQPETTDQWRYFTMTLDIQALKANSALTSSDTFAIRLDNSGDSDSPSFYEHHYWGLFRQTANNLVNLADGYFETAELKTLNVGNGIYVLNPAKTVQRGATQSPSTATEEFLCWIRSLNFNVVYEITLQITGGSPFSKKVVTVSSNGKNYEHTVGSGTTAIGNPVNAPGDKADGALVVDTSNEAVAAGLASELNSSSSLIVSSEGSILYVKIDPGAPIGETFDYVEADDFFNGENIVLLYKRVETDADLPESAVEGFRIEIGGDPETDVDDSYAIFVSNGGDVAAGEISEGFWIEDVAPGVDIEIDAATMPHLLRLLEDDSSGTITGTPFQLYFTYGQQEWTPRLVGDDDSNPFPSFVSTPEQSRRIETLFFVDNRLGFTSENNVVMSEAGNLLNYFRPSVTKIDPRQVLDVTANHKDATAIHATEVSQGQVVLLTKKVQFIMEGLPTFTPDTIAIRPLTEFESDDRAEAKVTQYTIAVPYSRDRFLGLNELRQTQADSPFDVQDTTEAVPQYFSGRSLDIQTSSVTGMISILYQTNAGLPYGRRLAIQNYLWNNRTKAQQAWHMWELGNRPYIIRHIHTQDFLYMLVRRKDTVVVERLKIDQAAQVGNATYGLHMDGRMESVEVEEGGLSLGGNNVTYDFNVTTPNRTVIQLPFDVNPDHLSTGYVRGAQGGPQGTEWSLFAISPLGTPQWPVSFSYDASTGRLTGDEGVDHRAALDGLTWGYRYESRVTLHKNYILEPSLNRGLRARLINQFDLTQLILRMRGIYAFDLEVDFGEWGEVADAFEGDTTAGAPQLESREVEFTVIGPADEGEITLKTDGLQPMGIVSVEMLGREGMR